MAEVVKDLPDSSSNDSALDNDSELSASGLVPVDPELTKVFNCLELIDDFRYS